MAKKKVILIASIVVSPIFLLIIARILNWYTFYNIPTTSMEPTIKVGQRLFATSLLSTGRNDIVSYYAIPCTFEKLEEKYLAVCRIVGVENDLIEIKNGILYVNDKMEIDTMNFGYLFLIKKDSLGFTPSEYDQANRLFDYSDSLFVLNFSYNELKRYNILKKCHRLPGNSSDLINPSVFGPQHTGAKWSDDNFGPVKVPAGKLFLLGDNRSNSADSRVRGFTDLDDIIAKIIW